MRIHPHSEIQLCTSGGAVKVIGTDLIYSYTRFLESFRISSVEQNVIRMLVVSRIFVIIQ